MPSTLHLHADRPGDIERAAEILQRGGLVAFPTETVYGLGADALSAVAVRRIFAAKERPRWDPLIVHLPDARRLPELAVVAGLLARRVELLAGAFWPGPLTMLLPRGAACPDEVTAGRPLVGIRVPAHPVAQALLRAAGVPVAAPSANRFGHVSPTTARHVLDDLEGRIDAVLDGGPADVGVESTVVDPSPEPMVVYRAGAIPCEALEAATGVAAVHFQPDPASRQTREALPSPGVGLRHYAPEVRLLLTGPSPGELYEATERGLSQAQRICLLLPMDWPAEAREGVRWVPWGRWSDRDSLAAGLFAALRSAERSGATLILCPLPEPGGVGDALRDRLLKAAMPKEP